MGRERDYGSEYEKSDQAPRYKFHGGSSRIGKRPPKRYQEPLIPVDENFYTPGEFTKEAERILAESYTFDTDNKIEESTPSTTPFQKQQSHYPNPQQLPTKQSKEAVRPRADERTGNL